MLVPLTVMSVSITSAALIFLSYQEQHTERIYTGVQIWGVELGELTRAEAKAAVSAAFPYPDDDVITFVNPVDGATWLHTPSDLGISFDVTATVEEAYQYGRSGDRRQQFADQFAAWYYGRELAPIIIFDEGKLANTLADLAAEIDRPAVDAELLYDGVSVEYSPSQIGFSLNQADAIARLLNPFANFSAVEIELLVEPVEPVIRDTSEVALAIENMISTPMQLYLSEPIAGEDLDTIEISRSQLTEWLRIETVTLSDGSLEYDVFLDQNGMKDWLRAYEDELYREPIRARFYFDDPTQELVLVEPHVNGRSLNIEDTVARINAQAQTANRSVALAMDEIVPAVNAAASGQELGITELLTEATTWFSGSSEERKHNIARSAVNFYGIVIAPGEEFSFNEWLGPISLEAGYETGLVIFGGRTQQGVGGGVCQVSTNVYQAAFWAGFPIVQRQEHGYRVSYYDDGEGPGMDATIYSPIVDFRFANNTPYHLLIENYYNEANESLTFKFYSTSLGRTVEKTAPIFENVTEPPPDIWEYNPDMEPGAIEQVDWAVEGADVSIRRIVRNANGDLLEDDLFISNYIPWPNIYQYGPEAVLPAGVRPANE